jgi:predicted nucleotidyltransferase
MKTLEEIKNIIRNSFDYLESEYNVLTIDVFGSYVKNVQSKKSDLDLLVTFSKAPSLLKYISLENYLCRILDLNVDLVMKKSLKPHLKKLILSEVHPI